MREIDEYVIEYVANDHIDMRIDGAFDVKSVFMVFYSFCPDIDERNPEEGELLFKYLVAQALKDILIPPYFSFWPEIVGVEDVEAQHQESDSCVVNN